MTYEMGVTENRMAHEYRNTETGEFEVIRRHGLYDVLETFLTAEGTVLFLAHNEYAAQPYVVGIYNSDHGIYWTDGDDARRHYGWRIAESFGLVVDKEGSKAVVPASRQYATTLVQQIRKAAGDLASAVDDQDVQGLDRSAAAVRDAAEALGKHLQRIGVLTSEVYDRSERIG
ncbi:hypothetical protein [Streptomyces noursei]